MPIIIKEMTAKTKASRGAVWKVWSDVANWNRWDQEIESARINGDFILGQTGELKPKGGPKAKTKIIELTPLRSFSDQTDLPLAKLRFDHRMDEIDGSLQITHKISVSGPLGFLFSKILGKNLKRGLERALPKLIELAESHGA